MAACATDVDPTPRPAPDLELLRTATLTVVGRFTDASNATLLVHLGLPGEPGPPSLQSAGAVDLQDLPADRLAVYKPLQGEAPLWDFPAGTLYRREVAAYVVDRLLGFNMVPDTIVRDNAPYGLGSLQRHMPHDPDHHYFWVVDNLDQRSLAQVQRMVLFDLIIENADRKGGHVLHGTDGHLWLVDHGVSFHAEAHIRTVAWNLAGTPVPAADRGAAARLVELLAPGAVGHERLIELLTRDEVAVTRERARRAASLEVFPEPRGERPYPWPPL